MTYLAGCVINLERIATARRASHCRLKVDAVIWQRPCAISVSAARSGRIERAVSAFSGDVGRNSTISSAEWIRRKPKDASTAIGSNAQDRMDVQLGEMQRSAVMSEEIRRRDQQGEIDGDRKKDSTAIGGSVRGSAVERIGSNVQDRRRIGGDRRSLCQRSTVTSKTIRRHESRIGFGTIRQHQRQRSVAAYLIAGP